MSKISDSVVNKLQFQDYDRHRILEERMQVLEDSIKSNNIKIEEIGDKLYKIMNLLTKSIAEESRPSTQHTVESKRSLAKSMTKLRLENLAPVSTAYSVDNTSASTLSDSTTKDLDVIPVLERAPSTKKLVTPQMFGIDRQLFSDIRPITSQETEGESEGEKYTRGVFSDYLRACLWGTQETIACYKTQTNDAFVKKEDRVLKYPFLLLFYIKAFIEYNSLDPDVEGVDIIIAAQSSDESAMFGRIMAGGDPCWNRAAIALLMTDPESAKYSSFREFRIPLVKMDPKEPFGDYIRDFEIHRLTKPGFVNRWGFYERFYDNIDDDVKVFVKKLGDVSEFKGIQKEYLKLKNAEKHYRVFQR